MLAKPNVMAAAEKTGDQDLMDEALAWYKVAVSQRWEGLQDVREQFRSADLVGECLVFNLRNNRYRLICKVSFASHSIFFKHLLTHKEYTRNAWKKDCKCN